MFVISAADLLSLWLDRMFDESVAIAEELQPPKM